MTSTGETRCGLSHSLLLGRVRKGFAYCDEWVEWEEMPQEIEDSPPDLEQEVAETEVGPTSSKIQNRDDFVAAMLQDPDLPCERTVAIKVYNYLSEKLEAWGISLDAAEMRHQLKTFMPDHVMKDTPVGSKGFTCADVEKWHENWNSSDSLTPSAGSQWESSDDLEEKVARADPQDALMVATFHEINEGEEIAQGSPPRGPAPVTKFWSSIYIWASSGETSGKPQKQRSPMGSNHKGRAIYFHGPFWRGEPERRGNGSCNLGGLCRPTCPPKPPRDHPQNTLRTPFGTSKSWLTSGVCMTSLILIIGWATSRGLGLFQFPGNTYVSVNVSQLHFIPIQFKVFEHANFFHSPNFLSQYLDVY